MEASSFSGTRLRQARRAKGQQRDELGRMVRRTEHSIASYESGRIDPPARIVAAMADALDVQVGSLFEHRQVPAC